MKNLIWVPILLIICIFFLINLTPIYCPDTSGYVSLAHFLENNNLDSYSFSRTPIYPAMILLVNYNMSSLIIIQMILLAVSIICLYFLAKDLLSSSMYANIAVIIFALNPTIWNYSSSILTESIVISFVIISYSLVHYYLKTGNILYALGGIFVCSISTLTRPAILFILLAFVTVLLVSRTLSRLQKGFVLLIPILVIGSWVSQVYSHTGMISIATTLPRHITNHTGAFIESAGAKYTTIYEPYISVRDSCHTHVMTIFRANNLMRENNPNITDSEYNQLLLATSLSAIRNRPISYMSSVLKSWINNHRHPNPSEDFLQQLGNSSFIRIFSRRITKLIAMLLMFFCYVSFIIKGFQRKLIAHNHLLPFLTILLFSSANAVFESPNGRYLMPILFLFVVYGIKSIVNLLTWGILRTGIRHNQQD